MGGVLSGSRGWRGGKQPTTKLPEVRLTHAVRFSLKPHPTQLHIEAPDFGVVVHGTRQWPVGIEMTRPNYGGHRRWLVCPCCQTRRMALYIDGPVLACRVCLGLRHESNHENRRQLALRKADHVRGALGWKPGILNHDGGKPKGMHWRTYKAHIAILGAMTEALLPDLNEWADRVERRLGVARH